VTWEPVGRALTERGHRVVVPSLQALQSTPADFVMRAAAEVRTTVQGEGLDGPVVLVGHDWAGPMLPAIGSALAARVVGQVFVDAHLPRNGATPMELVGGGRSAELLRRVARHPTILVWSAEALRQLIPDARLRERFLSELPRLPMAFFDEPIPVPGTWTSRPSAYLGFTPAYDDSIRQAEASGWPVRHLDGSHLHPLAEPVEVARAIEELAAELASRARPESEPARTAAFRRDLWPGRRRPKRPTERPPGPRVVLVDDDVVGRAFLRARLAIDGIRVVAEADTGESAVAVATRMHPDVVVMDVRMPGAGGLAATRAINDALPDAEVVVLTAFDEPLLGRAASESGAFAFVGKDSPAEVLVDLIRRAAAHDRGSERSRPTAP
jgi:CheY-like chemotaxis protein